MNLASIIVIIILLLCLIPAIIYLYKNGTCGSCPDKGACSGHCSSKSYKKDIAENESINALQKEYINNYKKEHKKEYKEKNKLIDEIIKKHRI